MPWMESDCSHDTTTTQASIGADLTSVCGCAPRQRQMQSATPAQVFPAWLPALNSLICDVD